MGLGGTGPRRTRGPPPTPSTGPGGPQHDGARGTEPGCALLGPPTKCSGLAELAPMKLGTRGSPLALAQARAVAARLRALGADVEVVPMRTEGDRLVDAHLAAVGGKGLFVGGIEGALREGHIAGAGHSLKDPPAEPPAGLTLRAFTERAYLGRLGASCNTPMAAHAVLDGARLRMTAFVASEDGRRVLRGAESGTPLESEDLGRRLAETLLARGAATVTALRV